MALPTRSWAIVVPGALLLALATLLAIGLRQGGTPQPVMASSPAQDRASLVQAIAALDDRFHSGDMEEMSYQEQRATLKAQLLRLAWQEEIAHAPATHGNGGEPR
ncbi:MAG: hypothetical protein EXR53_04170 [Dehalococcoidia bacterium]|nr:hypothetical protein [Dehalococcoidia bacterium]